MKLDYAYNDLSKLLADTESDHKAVITSAVYDTRRIADGTGILFFALKGTFRDGHDFIRTAYNIGVRHFVVSDPESLNELEDAHGIIVNDPLIALWELARFHRNRFNCEIVAITGSYGKTIVKEWLSQILSKTFNVAKSPKSYNSALGVPISLLELTENTDVAIIEVGVPEKGGMIRIKELIQPTQGIFTSFGKAHRSFFSSEEEHLNEKLMLFEDLDSFIHPSGLSIERTNAIMVYETDYEDYFTGSGLNNIDNQNALLAIAMSYRLGVDKNTILKSVSELKPLALRLETFDGVNGNLIINDTYSLNEDSLRLSLEYQLAQAKGKQRIVIVGMTDEDSISEDTIRSYVESFEPTGFYIHKPNDDLSKYNFTNSVILIKGSRSSKMDLLATELRKQMHKTYLEIDLKAIRNNINYHKSKLNPDTKLLCMIKAASYGADAKRMGMFLEQLGVNYLGVAYADEGMELRESGVSLPILVMNCEEESFHQCLEYNLEPAIYSLRQLDRFVSFLLKHSVINFPIHLKLETGMNRLGFEESELKDLFNLVKGQPEVIVKSVYSHLSTSDEKHSSFVTEQIDRFNRMSDIISKEFNHYIMKHILNSSGILNYPNAQYDMVRLGIGMYGVNGQPELQPAIKWNSSVSQIKRIELGEAVGYGRSFIASHQMTIAVIAVGYADGFRRSLGNNVGGVYIREKYCATVGNVCMDMIMVDITGKDIKEGDEVEIIGKNQSFIDFAGALNTIPYEVMTSFSERMPRIFIET